MSEIASRRRALLQAVLEHAVSAGAAALGVALLVATAWHLLRPTVAANPQLAASAFADGTTQRPPVAPRSRVYVTAPLAAHAALIQQGRGNTPPRIAERPRRPIAHAPTKRRPQRVAFAAKPAPRRAVAAKGRGEKVHRLVAVAPASVAAPKERHVAFAPPPPSTRRRLFPRAPERSADRPRAIPRGAQRSRAAVAFVRKPKHRARYRHRYGSFQAPLNYNPLPALATVPAQAPALEFAPESLPTPCTSRRHCR